VLPVVMRLCRAVAVMSIYEILPTSPRSEVLAVEMLAFVPVFVKSTNQQ
jgi:hypothetical protein